MSSLLQQLRVRCRSAFGRRLQTAKVIVGVVIRRGDQYLLLKEQREGKTVLNIPAGHVDPAETPIEAAVREAKEESGLDVTLVSLRLVLCNTWKKGLHTVYWIFDGEPCGGELRPEPGSIATWMSLDEWESAMKEMEVMPSIPSVFEAVKKNLTVPLDAVYFFDRREGVSRETL